MDSRAQTLIVTLSSFSWIHVIDNIRLNYISAAHCVPLRKINVVSKKNETFFYCLFALTSSVKQFIHLNVVIVLLLVSVWTGHYSGVTLRASTSLYLNILAMIPQERDTEVNEVTISV